MEQWAYWRRRSRRRRLSPAQHGPCGDARDCARGEASQRGGPAAYLLLLALQREQRGRGALLRLGASRCGLLDRGLDYEPRPVLLLCFHAGVGRCERILWIDKDEPVSTAVRTAPSVIARRALFDLLSNEGTPVTLVSAPAGSGKSVLLRSWLDECGLRDRAAWVSVERNERSADRFWASLLEALQTAMGGDELAEQLESMPGLEGQEAAARLVAELDSLDDEVFRAIEGGLAVRYLPASA